MEAACRMGGLLELSDSKSYEDLKKSDQKHYEDSFYSKVNEAPLGPNMTNSIVSVSESTPTDSGVQLLDSEISEMSVSGFESDTKIMDQSLEDALQINKEPTMTNSDIANCNISQSNVIFEGEAKTEDIVYRRKIKKKPAAPKKRVSFHEDILKNTRTDNIHIERGFITYKPVDGSSRYSWCSEGDYANPRRHVLQRNACSDVIDYGNTEVTPTLFVDNSGVFEYVQPVEEVKDKLYVCSCSGSDSSLTESDDAYDKNQKSASCDCIGSKNFQENIENGNYYYSEPNIGDRTYASMWSKEKKPKSSCLKKTSTLMQPIKNYNRHYVVNDKKNIFGSLKNIYKNMTFGLDLPERGVPEGSEDVKECLPDDNAKPKTFLSKSFDAGFCNDDAYPIRTKGDGYSRTYLHDVDAQLRRKNQEDIFSKDTKKDDVKRNKFIVNCESTVFEHTGVSYCYDFHQNFVSPQESDATIKDGLKDKLTSFLKTFTEKKDIADVVVLDKKQHDVSDNDSEISEYSNKSANKHLASPLKKVANASPKHVLREIPKINITQSSPFKQANHLDDSLSVSTDEDDTITVESGIENFEQLLKYPNSSSTSNNFKISLKVSNKTSLIDRFLRNITQKKILESKLHANDFYVKKLNSEKQVLKDLYVKRVRPKKELCDSLDEEIKREIEQNSPVKKNVVNDSKIKKLVHKNELGEVGSDCYGVFNKAHFRDRSEVLQKVYNVYSAYDAEGNMHTLTVFLTDQTLYVCELASSKSQRYRNAFVLPYGDLDVILVGPRGQTIMISNAARDMQLTLCVGGATTASSLAAAIELCVQKNNYIKRNYRPLLTRQQDLSRCNDWSGIDDVMSRSTLDDSQMTSSMLSQSILSDTSTSSDFNDSLMTQSVTSSNSSVYDNSGSIPGFGVLTMCHLSGLKRFVCENSSVEAIEPWHFYSIVHSKDLGSEINGDNSMSGYLMYRMLKGASKQAEHWQAAYFMLKGGVLYRFSSSTENNNSSIPCWACPLFQEGSSSCKGAHRLQCPPFERPHAFELLLMDSEDVVDVRKTPTLYRRTSFASSFFDSAGQVFGSSTCAKPVSHLNRLQLAASDEQCASDWLQALIQASSGVFDFPESKPAKACTLLLTSKHILLVRESFDNLLPLKSTLVQSSTNNKRVDKNIKLTVREKYLEFLRQQQTSITPNDDAVDASDKTLIEDDDKKQGAPSRSAMHLDLIPDIDRAQVSIKTNSFINVKESALTKDDAMSLASDASDSASCVTTSASDASAKMRVNNNNSPSVLDKIKRKISISDDKAKDKNVLGNINNSRKSEFGKGLEILTCASLVEVCAVKIPVGKSVENCCVVEFACHEVSESGGDMALFFTNSTDLDKFIATLEVLWSHNNTDDSPFPISTLDLNNQVNGYYGDTFQMSFKKNWMPTQSGLSQALRYK